MSTGRFLGRRPRPSTPTIDERLAEIEARITLLEAQSHQRLVVVERKPSPPRLLTTLSKPSMTYGSDPALIWEEVRRDRGRHD